jgi:hypothetical protein
VRHIVLIRATGLASSGGVITLANFLARGGFRLTVVCLEAASAAVPELSPGIELIGLESAAQRRLGKPWARVRAAVKLRGVLRNLDGDATYVVDSWTLPAVWLATGGKFRLGKAGLVYHTYDWLEPGLHPTISLRLERAACRAADLVVNSDRARARMQRTLYRLRETPLWVQNALPRSTPLPAMDRVLRRKLLRGNGASDACLLVYPTAVSNGESAQRLTFELINAFALLPERFHLATFFHEGAEHRRCLDLVASKRLQERVTFLPVVPLLQLIVYLGCADLGAILYDDCVSSGYFMASPDKLSLLAACGVPYVASDFPNLEAVTYRFGLGVCCDARDPVELARAIRELADGRVSLVERKAHVREVFERELYFEKHAGKLVEALRRVVEIRRG